MKALYEVCLYQDERKEIEANNKRILANQARDEAEPENPVCYEDEMKAPVPVNTRKIGGVYKSKNIIVVK